MANNTITLFSEEFENEKTGETVQGITVIVDGKIKDVMDRFLYGGSDYKNYTEIVRDVLIKGFNVLITEQREKSR